MNESIALTAFAERSSSAYRLSVMEEQTSNNRQEFSIQVNLSPLVFISISIDLQMNETSKLISINRTWQRVYNLKSSSGIQILCDTQIHHHQRRVILSSIVKVRIFVNSSNRFSFSPSKIFNHTTYPLVILDLDSMTGKTSHHIGSNEEFYIPVDLLYQNSNPSIMIGVDDQSRSIQDYFALDWPMKKTLEQNLQLKDGRTVHLIISTETKKAYAENTDQLDRVSHCIYIHSPIQLTNLLSIDLQCSINVSRRSGFDVYLVLI